MQAVLDQLAALSAKPVETLSVAQARSQSGPANAVKALLVKVRPAFIAHLEHAKLLQATLVKGSK